LRDEKADAIAALTEQMNGTVSALTMERDKFRSELSEAERRYSAEIASLLTARDSAQHDSAAVAERLAAVSVEAQQKHAQLTQERDAIQAEKDRIAAELEQARETHKAQAGVFASEFKTVVKQRDEALALLDAERIKLAAKLREFEQERAALASADAEAKTRFERDLARLRRERDSIAQQRDALRERIGKLVNEQTQMLEEVTTQAAFTAMKHTDTGTVTPPESRAAEPEPEPVAPAKPREPKKKETNVIDISAAEIVAPTQDEEGRIKIPRVRPVVIPPPQVRIL
jgi:chromosome segregation ATPase